MLQFLKIVPYLDNLSDNKKEYKQNIYKYLMMQIKLCEKTNKPRIKKERKKFNDKIQYVVEKEGQQEKEP